ncbi:hypothetical protein C1H46_009204 [Malus baccata]|uniref:Uncharacterized protein n=1 Tax=Malus baccata TaxID=106549 RepID=A0A540N2G2_MALBA|nr:hypothetical protein C1H46_009204 [Malus baccata]
MRHDRMSTILVRYAGMSCKRMIMCTRTGRRGRRRPKKTENEMRMRFEVVNTCMFNV